MSDRRQTQTLHKRHRINWHRLRLFLFVVPGLLAAAAAKSPSSSAASFNGTSHLDAFFMFVCRSEQSVAYTHVCICVGERERGFLLCCSRLLLTSRPRAATPVRARRPPRPKSYRKVRSLCAWDLFGRSCLSQKFMDTLANARAPLPLLSFTASFSAKALAEYALCAFFIATKSGDGDLFAPLTAPITPKWLKNELKSQQFRSE